MDTNVVSELRRGQRANPVTVIDGLLAATAMVHGLVVATRNLADFEPTGVDCLNPFS